MGQILGLGLTHSPPLLAAAGDTASRIKRMMAELGGRKPQETRFVESWLTNANKVFAVFRP